MPSGARPVTALHVVLRVVPALPITGRVKGDHRHFEPVADVGVRGFDATPAECDTLLTGS